MEREDRRCESLAFLEITRHSTISQKRTDTKAGTKAAGTEARPRNNGTGTDARRGFVRSTEEPERQRDQATNNNQQETRSQGGAPGRGAEPRTNGSRAEEPRTNGSQAEEPRTNGSRGPMGAEPRTNGSRGWELRTNGSRGRELRNKGCV